MNWLKELFSEQSNVSMMRAVTFIVTISAVILAFSMIFIDKNFETLIIGMLGVALGSKAVQKFGEKK